VGQAGKTNTEKSFAKKNIIYAFAGGTSKHIAPTNCSNQSIISGG